MTDARTLMRRAGWFPGRQIDMREDLAALTAAGFVDTSAAASFLAEFSGLRLTSADGTRAIMIDGSATRSSAMEVRTAFGL